jgi:RNA polymerase sigma-70 factor, ECF subfamily
LDEARRGAASTEDDRRLVRRVLAGDQEAFALLVRRHQRLVARIAGRFFRQRETIEDVAQETFLKAFQALAGYRGELPLEHWLSRITVNACYDQLRRQRRRDCELVPSQLGLGPPELWDRLTATAADADVFWRREDARLTAEQLLARLAPAERLVLTLMVLEEQSVREVARMTGWTVTNVKVRAFRARRRLRRLLQEDVAVRGGRR